VNRRRGDRRWGFSSFTESTHRPHAYAPRSCLCHRPRPSVAEAATTGKESALSIPCNRGASRGAKRRDAPKKRASKWLLYKR